MALYADTSVAVDDGLEEPAPGCEIGDVPGAIRLFGPGVVPEKKTKKPVTKEPVTTRPKRGTVSTFLFLFF